MFADASALTAILLKEPDEASLVARMQAHTLRVTSPLAVWETVMAVSRGLGLSIAAAEAAVENLLKITQIEVRPVLPEVRHVAVEAHARFGKGRHPAALNFGDCFAYGCARHARVPLLYKGEDFSRTDIEAA
ncbi:type II toxin-antitoxin system VapC family toxin [Brevundimonas sp.]|uniref:type II toxin-antitoxin system VapC family toxin n=1 Tax=Brevundimonas sp. TaxID=1871086 RepID=UPI002D32CBA4|nr:type II toxin-antitoxin system VapC family toxin [Brevundimonas sp.]HYC69223.1 type II toxin-antitoxin system VapC family toxin [Brevundimonas sp.]